MPLVGLGLRTNLAASRGLRPRVGARLRRVRSPSNVRTSTTRPPPALRNP